LPGLNFGEQVTAEQFMVSKIKDENFVAGISANQTPVLFKKFKELFPGETENIDTLHSVV